LRAVLLLDSWNTLQVLQHAPWLGRLLAASLLRQAGLTTAAHLTAFNLGLESIPVDRRRHPGRNTRLLAPMNGLVAAAEFGLKEHDRLALARQVLERRLIGRRASSKLPELIDLGDGAATGVGGHGGRGACRDAAGGAQDGRGTGFTRDDGAGEVSGVGNTPKSRLSG